MQELEKRTPRAFKVRHPIGSYGGPSLPSNSPAGLLMASLLGCLGGSLAGASTSSVTYGEQLTDHGFYADPMFFASVAGAILGSFVGIVMAVIFARLLQGKPGMAAVGGLAGVVTGALLGVISPSLVISLELAFRPNPLVAAVFGAALAGGAGGALVALLAGGGRMIFTVQDHSSNHRVLRRNEVLAGALLGSLLGVLGGALTGAMIPAYAGDAFSAISMARAGAILGTYVGAGSGFLVALVVGLVLRPKALLGEDGPG